MLKLMYQIQDNGLITIYWPKGTMPDRPSIERLHAAIKAKIENPSANGNSQKGSTENGTIGQAEYTASGAKIQDLEDLFQQLTHEEQQATLKLMRDMIEGRA